MGTTSPAPPRQIGSPAGGSPRRHRRAHRVRCPRLKAAPSPPPPCCEHNYSADMRARVTIYSIRRYGDRVLGMAEILDGLERTDTVDVMAATGPPIGQVSLAGDLQRRRGPPRRSGRLPGRGLPRAQGRQGGDRRLPLRGAPRSRALFSFGASISPKQSESRDFAFSMASNKTSLDFWRVKRQKLTFHPFLVSFCSKTSPQS